MNRTFLLIGTFLIPCTLFFVNAKNVVGFITERDKRISVNTPAKIVHSKLACTSLCLQNSGCCFANYNVLTKECILGNSRCHDETESATGWLFLRRGKKRSSYLSRLNCFTFSLLIVKDLTVTYIVVNFCVILSFCLLLIFISLAVLPYLPIFIHFN